MIFKRYFIKYVKELKPYKAAIISVVIAIVSSAGISIVSETGTQVITAEMNAMGMQGYAASLYNIKGENKTDNYFYNHILESNSTEHCSPVITDSAAASLSNGTEISALVWGIGEQFKDIVSMHVVAGRFFNKYDEESNALVCLIDENIAKEIYKRPGVYGKNIVLSIGDRSAVFTIIGTVKKNSNVLNTVTGQILPDFIYIPHTTMKNFTLKSNYDQIIYTSFDDTASVDDFKLNLKEKSKRYNNFQINITSLSQQKEQINNIATVSFFALYMVSCISLVVCSVSVASSVNTAVISKQKDIGVKLSMGASRFDITSEFLISAISACICGIMVSATLLFTFISLLKIVGITVYFNGFLIVISISVTIILTALFGFLPSYNASKMLPIKALNRE